MKYPWMPLFWGDFLANTMHLSAQEAGAYLFLIAHAWEHEGKIPVDRLKRVARVNSYQWPKVRAALVPFFDITVESNFWLHSRVIIELTNAGKLSNKRKDAALQMHSKRRASASVLHMHPHLQPFKESSLGKLREAQPMQMHPEFEYTQTYTPSGMSPDKGFDYRSPPRTKSDNKLEPIPDKPK